MGIKPLATELTPEFRGLAGQSNPACASDRDRALALCHRIGRGQCPGLDRSGGVLGRRDAAPALLHHVCQFMRQQSLAGYRPPGVLAGAKDDVLAHRIGFRLDRGGGCFRLGVEMDTHAGEAVAEPGFHRFPQP